jgi:hypothetical protein
MIFSSHYSACIAEGRQDLCADFFVLCAELDRVASLQNFYMRMAFSSGLKRGGKAQRVGYVFQSTVACGSHGEKVYVENPKGSLRQMHMYLDSRQVV